MPLQAPSQPAIVGFGFVGMVLGSFVGWCTGLLSHVTGQTLFEYMVVGAAIGIAVGMIFGFIRQIRGKTEFSHKTHKKHKRIFWISL